MDEPLTEAEKARLVWKAAFPKASRLDDETAPRLDKKLARAVEWYAIAETNRPPRERERLENIERTAEKLARLLAESPGTRGRLEEFWPMYFGRIGLQQARLGIAALRKTARRARIVETPTETVRRKGGGAALRALFGSPQRLFILRVAAAYEEFSGKKAKVSCDVYNGKIGGPFVRFVKEAAMRFGLDQPSAEAIKKALRRRKHGYAAREKSHGRPIFRERKTRVND